MNSVAEKLKEKLEYEAIRNALSVKYQDYGSFQVYDNVRLAKSASLYNQIKELTEMAYPTFRDADRTIWTYFYVPLQFEGMPALIPMEIIKQTKKPENEETYIVGFASLDLLQFLEVAKGEEKEPLFSLVMEKAKEFLPNLTNVEEIEMHVPYHFRKGRIKNKYISKPEQIITKEKAEEIKAIYKDHITNINKLPNAKKPISLSQYLHAVSVAIKAVYPEYEKLAPLEIYKRSSDFRDGGMLSITNFDSVEEFNQWYESNKWQGSHPFEIIAGYRLSGISLYPPKAGGYFVLTLENNSFAEAYIRSLLAMIQAGIPVKAPQLNAALRYLTGEYYVEVNVPGSIAYFEIPEDKLKYVKWEKLKVVKPKSDIVLRK